MGLPQEKSKFDAAAYLAWEAEQPERHELAGVRARQAAADQHGDPPQESTRRHRRAVRGLTAPVLNPQHPPFRGMREKTK